jgi:hypothetical protein
VTDPVNLGSNDKFTIWEGDDPDPDLAELGFPDEGKGIGAAGELEIV